MSREQPPCPPEFLAQIERINKERLMTTRTNARLVPYLEGDSDFGDQWKAKLVLDEMPDMEFKHLFPDGIPDHTVYLMTTFIRAAERRGMIRGLAKAAENLSRDIYNDVFAGTGIQSYEMPEDVRAKLGKR